MAVEDYPNGMDAMLAEKMLQNHRVSEEPWSGLNFQPTAWLAGQAVMRFPDR